MTVRIRGARIGLVGALVVATAWLAIGVGTASASSGVVVYNNLNTVPGTVNGLPDQDTYSAAPFEFPFGGLVEIHALGVMKSLTLDVDSFTCEHGVYSLENCYTLRKKKFIYGLTADVYAVGAGHAPGPLLASSTAKFKIPYRPTTNVSCPATIEGKGFGANCDVGGYLSTVTFKKFTNLSILPHEVIILFTSTPEDNPDDVVNIGTQTAYKEYNVALSEFVAEPPLNGGKPEIGSDPLPADTYIRSALTGGQQGFQPAMEVSVSQ